MLFTHSVCSSAALLLLSPCACLVTGLAMSLWFTDIAGRFTYQVCNPLTGRTDGDASPGPDVLMIRLIGHRPLVLPLNVPA